VAAKDPENKRKITGFMIWNFEHSELIKAIKDDKLLSDIFEKSKKNSMFPIAKKTDHKCRLNTNPVQ